MVDIKFARGNAWMSKVDIKLGCQQGWQLGCQLKFLLDVNWMSTWMTTWMSIQKKNILSKFLCIIDYLCQNMYITELHK